MRKCILLFLLLVSIASLAQQKKRRYSPIVQKGFFLTLNPYSPFEMSQGAVGLGAGYRFSERVELWTQFDYLYKGFFYDGDDFSGLKGFRSITSFRYYYNNKHGFFVGAEFRFKRYSYRSETDIANPQRGDTITNYRYEAVQSLPGGALFWGKRFKLTPNGKFELEVSIGLGVKNRIIDRRGLPAGYSKLDYEPGYRRVSPLPDHDEEGLLPYLPAGVRLILHL